MSLLNDMLKDLDGKKESNISNHPEEGPTAASSKFNLRHYLLPTLAGVAIIFWAVVELDVFGFFPKKVESALPASFQPDDDWSSRLKAKQKAQAGDSENQDEEKINAEEVASGSKDENRLALESHENVNGEASEDTAKKMISSMLEKAHKLMSEGKKIKPEGNNAYQVFANVLALEAGNITAKKGVNSIQMEVLSALNETEDKRSTRELQRLLKDASLVNVNAEAIRHYTRTLNRLMQVKPEVQESVNAGSGVKRTQPKSDYDLAKKIREEGLAGLEKAALRRLKNKKNYTNTAVALVKNYFTQGDVASLKKISALLNSRDSYLTEFVKAHKEVLEGRFDEAVTTLEGTQLNGFLDIERVRTLAGLYQHQKNDEKAVVLYQQLVSSRAVQVSDWLGLAVANDRLGHSRNALMAYQKVRALGHPDPNVMNFVSTRLRRM